MWRRLVLVVAFAQAACGGAQAPAAPSDHPAADPSAAVDLEAPFQLAVDVAALRALGWLEAFKGILSDQHDRWKGLKRVCRLDFERDVRRLEVTKDEHDEILFAIAPAKPVDNKLECITATARDGFFTEAEVSKIGQPDTEIAHGLLLIGSARALNEAIRRLDAGDPETKPPERVLLRIKTDSNDTTVDSVVMRVTGDASVLRVRVDARYAGEPAPVEELRKRLGELMGATGGKEAADREIARALGSAVVKVDGQVAVIEVALHRAPKLGERMAAIVEKMTTHGKVGQCDRLIEVINREQQPLKEASGSDPDALVKLAHTLDQVASAVGAVELTDKTLIGFRESYVEMAKDLADASRATAHALAVEDPKLAADAAKNMSSFGPRESALVDDINRYCSGEP